MACRYEEEICSREGKVDECGCHDCPYRNLEDCVEVVVDIDGLDSMDGIAGYTDSKERRK